MTPPGGDDGGGVALSNTGAAVLGMIALGARSGYEIRRAAEVSVRFFWALGPPQVYAQLKQLEADGLVAGRDDARGGRSRRTYSPTPAGETALGRWVADPGETGPLELRDPELLRLFFADSVDREQARARVEHMRRRSERALEQFRGEIRPAAARTRAAGSEFPELVADFGQELHGFIADWCARLEARLAEGRPTPDGRPASG